MITHLLSLFAATCQDSSGFFGLKPWYYYLPDEDFFKKASDVHHACDIRGFTLLPGPHQTSDIPLVLLAVVDDMLRIVGIVAVAFVIVGAIQYISSQGEPEKTARAQSTILNALIGAAVATVAVAFVSFLGHKL